MPSFHNQEPPMTSARVRTEEELADAINAGTSIDDVEELAAHRNYPVTGSDFQRSGANQSEVKCN